MKVSHTWIFFFFLALQDGNTGLVNGRIYKGKEGGNITVECLFSLYGSRRLFCRNKCEEGNILIETTEDTAQTDRYSIEYIHRGRLSAGTQLNLSITQLKKSDSGQYRCSLNRTWLPHSYDDFEISVTEASTPPKPTLSLGPFSSSSFLPSSSTSPTTHSSSSTSGSSTSSSSSSSSSSEGPSPTGSGLILYVALTLVFIIIIFSVALLIFCKWRTTMKPKGSPMETVYVTETNQVYEEIREDEQSSSSPVGVSTVYTCVKHTKANGAEDDGDLSKPDYYEGDYSNIGTSSLNSAPRGYADSVIYSVPRAKATSANHSATGASPPLYSTLQ